MKTNTQNGFGLLAAVLVVAALTAGSFAAVKVNESIKASSHATSTASSTVHTGQEGYMNASEKNRGLMLGATSTASTSKNVGQEGYLNANVDNNGLMIGASSTIKINR